MPAPTCGLLNPVQPTHCEVNRLSVAPLMDPYVNGSLLPPEDLPLAAPTSPVAKSQLLPRGRAGDVGISRVIMDRGVCDSVGTQRRAACNGVLRHFCPVMLRRADPWPVRIFVC